MNTSTHKKWDLKTQLIEKINNKGGFVNCHGHFDKAFYVTKRKLNQTMIDMEKKWHMSDDIKKNSTQKDIEKRIETALDIMIDQNIKITCSFIDAYDAVGEKAIKGANKVKEKYKDKIQFITATQPLGGLVDEEAIELYEKVTAQADIAGGLPSVDRPNDDKHFDALFNIAKNQGKDLHIHIDQENNPHEKDTEKLIEYTEKYNYQGKVAAVHAISTAAQEKTYRDKIHKQLAENDISVIVCPSADLAMKQLDQHKAPVHNSIPNVPEMLEAGVNVGIGVDNICDFYQPFVDGDMWVETRMLMEACRYYNFEEIVKICNENGKKALKVNNKQK